MGEAKPTPGECRCTPRAVDESGNWASRIPFAIEIAVGAAVIPVADVCAQPQAEANAALITEAFNVHNTTGLTSSQLVEQRDGLAGLLSEIYEMVRQGALPNDGDEWFELTSAALSKARPNTAEGEVARLLRQILAASQDGDSDTHLSAHFVSRIETITKPGGAA